MENISLPSVFDNPNSPILNQSKQNEQHNENRRMNNEPTSTKISIHNGIDVNSSMRWSILQDIEDRKLSLAIVKEKVKKLNSAECMLLYMHLPQYACSDGSVESNFKLQRNTFIKNSFVSLVSDSMKGTINTLSEEIKNLQENVDIIEQQLFDNAGVMCGRIFNNLNFNKSVQNVIAWCKINYKQKLDSVVIKSDMHNHYSNDVKNVPLMSSFLFGKLVLIIFPLAAVTKNYKGILQYKNLSKLENVLQTSEVNMDSIASELSCKQIFDIYDQVINHISRKVAKLDNRQESQQNNVTVTLNNDNENDSYRSGELDGCTVIVHDPLSLLNLSASVNIDNRKKVNNVKVKSTNNVTNDPTTNDQEVVNSSVDSLTPQKLADIIGYRLEIENNGDAFRQNLNIFKSKFKGRKFKEHKHASVKRITAEYPKINFSTNLIKLNLFPNVAIDEAEILNWYVKRFTALKEKLSKISSSQIPGKGMHKLHCGCCNVNFEVGDGYIRGLDLLRNKLRKLKIVNGPGTKIYIEKDPNEIIEIVDEEPVVEHTKLNIPRVNNVQMNNKIPVITKTETLATSKPRNNVKVAPPSSSKEILTKTPPTPVPQITSKPLLAVSQIIIKPPVTSFRSATIPVESPQVLTKKSLQSVTQDVVPSKVVPQIDIPVPPSYPAVSPQLVIESPVEVPQVVNKLPTEMPPSISKPLTVSQKIITKPVTVSSQIVSKPKTVSSQIVSKPGTVYSQIGSKPGTVSSQTVANPGTVSSKIVSKPATVSSQIVSKPATVSYRIVSKPATVSSQIFSKATIVSSQATTKPARKSFSLQLKKNTTVQPPIKNTAVQPPIKNTTVQPPIKNATVHPPIKNTTTTHGPILSKPSPQENTNITPIVTNSPTISNERTMPKMILLKDLLDNRGPPISNIRLSSLNISKASGNKKKYTAKQVDNGNHVSLSKPIRIQKVLEGIPTISKNITEVSSNVQQHISIQSLYKKYNEIVLPKTVMHSDVAPVVVLNSGEVCDWYLEKMNNLKRLMRKYKKKSQKTTSSSPNTTVAITGSPSDTTINTTTTTTSLTLENNSNTNVLSCRRSKARLMNFCEIDSDGEGDIVDSRGSVILCDLLNKSVSPYVSQVTLKRARTETYDERGNKKRKIFREHKVVSNEESIDTNLIEISDDIPIPDDDKVYKCTFCLKTFFGIAQLLYHNKTHLYCKTCKKRYRNVDSMLKHLTNHCVVNARKCTPCLKLQRVDAVVNIAEAKTARNNSNVVPKPKQVKKNSLGSNKKCNIQSNTTLNTSQLQELLNSQSNSILQQMMMSSMKPPKLVPTSSTKTSQAVSLSGNSNAIQQSSSSNANHGSVYLNASAVPISSQSLSMPLLQPPPLVSTSASSKSLQISKPQQSYTTNQIQLQPVIQQQSAQAGQLKNAINNNYNKIYLLNNLQGANFMCSGQVVINNENAYLVTSSNQPYINNPISSSYNVPPSFNVVTSIASPVVQQLNIQPNGLEDHSYHQQRLPLQDENVDVANTNNPVLQPPGNNPPDGGSFKLRVRSLHELR